MEKAKKIIWGVVLIAAGVLWALSTLDLIYFNIFFDGWWTLFIIIPSVISLFTGSDKIDALIWLSIGAVLLLCARGVLEYGVIFKLIFPAAVVIIGVKLVFNSFADRKIDAAIKEMAGERGEIDNVFAIFSGQKIDFGGRVFRGAQIDAVFGGVEYDLRGAVIEPDCAIKASAIFGGIDIFIPENVNVKVKPTNIFGGTSNKAKRSDKGEENVITIYVSAFSMFGGVDIK